MWRSICLFYTNYNNTNNHKDNVFVLGQGWVAKGFIEHIDKSKYNIINITKNNFVNLPLILSTIHSDKNISNQSFQKKIDLLINETIENIDIDNNTIKTNKKSYCFKNDYVVVGLGTTQDNGEIWSKNIEIIKSYKPKSKVIVVGSGPTGTELAFHLSDLGHNVSIIDILPNEKLYSYLSYEGKDLIFNKFYEKNIALLGNTNLKYIEDSCNYSIQAFVPRSNILTKNWKINSKLQLESNNRIFAGGDCIIQEYPPTAQLAYQQGKYIAKQLNDKNNIKNFKYKNNGIALYIGDDTYYIETEIFGKKIKFKLPKKIINIYKSI